MKRLNQKGELLIEALIAISLIVVLSLTLVGIVLVSTRAHKSAGLKSQATLLAREGMEATRAISQEKWNNVYKPLGASNKGSGNPYHPKIQSGAWVLENNLENIILDSTTYTRKIFIDNVSRENPNGDGGIVTSGGYDDPSTQKITVEVTIPNFAPIVIREYFSRWGNIVHYQTDWGGGANQGNATPCSSTDGTCPNTQYDNSSNIDNTGTSGKIKLAPGG